MSIKIHYGPNGSYKTAGALADDMIPAWKSGRVIVTNVRGVSAQRFAHVLNVDESEGGDVIHVDTSTSEGRLRMATWFHWAPPGALVFVDEAQAIWPKAWTQKDLQVLDYPGGSAQAEADDRPHCYSIAWEMHRHWNWDFILTTPNINKLRDEYRGCADGAYKHKNLALIGLSGRYVEGFHAPDDTGKAQSDFISITRKKVPSYVFKCYDSTATGKVSDTISGTPLWKNPRVVLLVTVLVCIGLFVASRPVPKVLGGEGVAPAAPERSRPARSAPVGVAQSAPAADGVPARRVAVESGDVLPALAPDPWEGGVLAYGGSIGMGARQRHVVTFSHPDRGTVVITGDELVRVGWVVVPVGDCLAKLVSGKQQRVITCAGPAAPLQREREGREDVGRTPAPSAPGPQGVVIADAGTNQGIPPVGR
ncbi:zonular occludens toxin family protein [Aromatoleum evansii]|uniref:zonular occludens toxin family protein n=1 Tax=Aromatoleum evansii TaxID=59406 RepID=UPI00145D0B87|nr:zonular occludens toxin domain-containing protein [Aromatoleum evansii]NMG32604.1 hypothetical protein [Aromatoleum evansii]